MHFQDKLAGKSRKKTFRDKEILNKIPLMFLHVISLPKAKYCVFRRCQHTSKVQGMYLAFTGLKIRCKKEQNYSES